MTIAELYYEITSIADRLERNGEDVRGMRRGADTFYHLNDHILMMRLMDTAKRRLRESG